MVQTIQENIKKDLIAGMKAKDRARVAVLRMIKTAIMNKEIDLKTSLSNEDVVKILRNQIKTRKESIEQFKKAQRVDLIKKEEEELDIIQKYLPVELPKEEIIKIVQAVIKKTQATSKKEIGKVMPEVIKQIAGRASGNTVKDVVLSLLGN